MVRIYKTREFKTQCIHNTQTKLIRFDTTLITIGILTFCAVLNIIGITESAKVSLTIFCFHLLTMVTLVVCSIVTAVRSMPRIGEHTVLDENWNDTTLPHSLPLSLFYGLGAGLLGVSGFESSANFRESQADGVFPKTLRNMWVIVTTLNPVLGILAMCLLPLSTISDEATSGALLSAMADVTSKYLKICVGIDAFCVLTGAVLSAFVGFTGLSIRMSYDGDLPRVLQSQTPWNTPYCIILSYFVLTVTMLLMCSGDIADLSGVYTIAFLAVRSCVAIGNMLLKYQGQSAGLRKAPPEQTASWCGVAFALAGVMMGLVSNVMSRSTTALLAFVGFSTFFTLVIIATRTFEKPRKRRSSSTMDSTSLKHALLSSSDASVTHDDNGDMRASV